MNGHEVVPYGEGQMVAAPGSQLPELFSDPDPTHMITKATAIATALTKVIEDRKLYVGIKAKKPPYKERRHVLFEGWLLLGALSGGVFPYVVAVERLDPERLNFIGYTAHAEARFKGMAISGAESQCTSDEDLWRSRSAFQIKSMAQTRASAKAMSMALRWIMSLAGFEGTPAEEIGGSEERDDDDDFDPSARDLPPAKPPARRQKEPTSSGSATEKDTSQPACDHLSERQVETRWQYINTRKMESAMCVCCKGPCNIGNEYCKACDPKAATQPELTPPTEEPASEEQPPADPEI